MLLFSQRICYRNSGRSDRKFINIIYLCRVDLTNIIFLHKSLLKGDFLKSGFICKVKEQLKMLWNDSIGKFTSYYVGYIQLEFPDLMNKVLLWIVCSMQYVGHINTKKFSFAYLKIKFNWAFCILPTNSKFLLIS